MVPLFEDGELDDLVHVGTVRLNTLLTSILYDVTLAEYVEEEFVDVHDFNDIPLDPRRRGNRVFGLHSRCRGHDNPPVQPRGAGHS